MSAKPSRSNSASVTRSDPNKTTPRPEREKMSVVPKDIISVIDSLKQQVEAQRKIYVKSIMDENRQKLSRVTISKERRNVTVNNMEKLSLLVKRQDDAIIMHNRIKAGNEDDDVNASQENAAILLGSSYPNKNAIRTTKLPEVKRLPPYTTWIFLDRNQRMPEDQSVVGRRRIYYDPNGGEALICSDSEEEVIEDEEDKKEFVRSEDYILRMTVQEVGLSDAVLDLLGQCFSKKPSDVKARYEVLCEKEKAMTGLSVGDTIATSGNSNPYLDKDLEGALDSFDNLFCRRCYVFDCRLHGCSQDLIFPTEKQHPWSSPEEASVPCGQYCYRSAPKCEGDSAVFSQKCDGSEAKAGRSSGDAFVEMSPRKKSNRSSNKRSGKSTQSESASSNARNASDSSDSDERLDQDNNSVDQSSIQPKGKLVGKSGACKSRNKRAAERILVAMQKRHKKVLAQDADSVNNGPTLARDMKLRSRVRKEDEVASISHKKGNISSGERSRKVSPAVGSSKSLNFETPSDPLYIESNDQSMCNLDEVSRKELVDESPGKLEVNNDNSWKALEKALYEKGLEIFGRNSCLITRNLLNGLKTCSEVYQYMTHMNIKLSCQGGDDGANLDCNETMGNEVRRRSRYVRRRGRVRRLKYTWKSTGYHSIRKRISERKDQPCRQYNPCGCESACGKQCSCLLNGTCCEKYCGCPKSCKNRFRGCHCAKSQCRSRQCPCFAADRECDPDVCRNCWVSCGDGTLGVPNQRGDNYGCRNMKLLLKQQQRVLLGRSDVSGWGAFLKNSVGKHEYLGEYTGELISHREADKRGKIYDRENSSFLFNLNDQFVLDAYRKGDKLKFANHSPDPNCYAKVIMVAGDHRVGIFAKERINAGEELFYDYRYEPDRAPAWARKPEEPGTKKDAAGPSSGRAKKLA